MRPSNAVQIAKIVSVAVIVSSLIIGCFILASSYIQARATCDQMQTLDSVLAKELMLETLQDLPKPEALQAQATVYNNDNSLTNDEKTDSVAETTEQQPTNAQDSDNYLDNQDSSEDGEEKVHVRLPLELDLSDLAGALLMNNQKSRMNCVVERRRTEESVDAPAKNMQLPFGMNISTDSKKQKITGERIAIFCDNGSEEKREEQAEPIPRVVAMPMNAIPIHFRPQFPLTHMPQQMPPQRPPQQPQPMPQFAFARQQFPQQSEAPSFRQIPLPLQPFLRQFQQQSSAPNPFMQSPRQEQPEIRIQLQRIALPSPISSENREMPHMPQQMPQVQIQRVPLGVALQQVGITSDDLRNIQRMAEERIQQELRDLANEEDSSEEDDDSDEESKQHQQQQQQLLPSLPYGRFAYGRSLVNPVKIPVPMQTQEVSADAETTTAANAESERPHYVQPRSVRSVDEVFPREKRVKRCACDCNC